MTLAVLNQMVHDGIIERYAIGGAIAAARYVEPIQTYDLDVFVIFPGATSGLITLGPIYSYLRERNYLPVAEAVEIEGWPVQFLPVFNALTEEALNQADVAQFGQTSTRVLSAEHLAAIMLQTGRPKDHARLIQFLDSDAIDNRRFLEILKRHDLLEKWDSFRGRFLAPGAQG